MIYGVATLAGCMFAGQLVGNLLGLVLGTGSDIGGVGFAMLLLLIITSTKKFEGMDTEKFSKGIGFWKGMYIPIVVAMAASQNVYQALSGGWIAIIAGVLAVVAAFALLPLINKLCPDNPGDPAEKEEGGDAK